MIREFAGIPVIVNDYATPGQVLFARDVSVIAGVCVVMHPLDKIAFDCTNPFDRLDKAMAWIVADAHRRLDALAAYLAANPDDN